jgi:hypothetical protein
MFAVKDKQKTKTGIYLTQKGKTILPIISNQRIVFRDLNNNGADGDN